ncbi:hypothetical protein AOB60_08665 [Streptomyces noursei]|uniref:Uncharacterized protein n=1 Tax=Streptomyces noursei TaxID=1971 RepID=A0A2N8PIQ5_STRNR|nr:hypothetical protein AOB60_08665 [Streptomyces noursei]
MELCAVEPQGQHLRHRAFGQTEALPQHHPLLGVGGEGRHRMAELEARAVARSDQQADDGDAQFVLGERTLPPRQAARPGPR